MEIKITLIQSLIINSVKNETYHRGQLMKAADEKSSAVAYHDQAGDESHHEAMLLRSMFSQVERLKTWFSDYLAGTGYLANDPLIDSEEQGDIINISLEVSDRFNTGYVKTLARLSQKYVEDRMIHLWWSSSDDKLSAMYAKIAEDDLAGIRRCFNKKSPKAPAYNYPTAINLSYPIIPDRDGIPGWINGNSAVTPLMLFSNPWYIGQGENSDISYTVTGDAEGAVLDDVVVRADDPCCVPVINDGHWGLHGCHKGITIVTLFSRHDDTVFAKFCVRVV